MHPTADPGGVGSEPNCHCRIRGSCRASPASAHGDRAKGAGWLPSPWCLRAGEKRTIRKANKQQRGTASVMPADIQLWHPGVKPGRNAGMGGNTGRRKPPNPGGEGEAATPEWSPPKLWISKSIPSWKSQREAVQLDTALLPHPGSSGQGARGCP